MPIPSRLLPFPAINVHEDRTMRRTRHPIAVFGFPSNVLDLRGLSLLSSFPTRERCLRSDANCELRAGADWLPRIGDFGRLGDSLSAGDPLVSHPIVGTGWSRSHRAREGIFGWQNRRLRIGNRLAAEHLPFWRQTGRADRQTCRCPKAACHRPM